MGYGLVPNHRFKSLTTDDQDDRPRTPESRGVLAWDPPLWTIADGRVGHAPQLGLIPHLDSGDIPGFSSCDRALVAIRKSSLPARILPPCLHRRNPKNPRNPSAE